MDCSTLLKPLFGHVSPQTALDSCCIYDKKKNEHENFWITSYLETLFLKALYLKVVVNINNEKKYKQMPGLLSYNKRDGQKKK